MKEFNFKKKKLDNKEIIFKKNDFRGYLARIFCKKQYSNLIKNFSIKQINHTLTKKELLEVYISKPNLLRRINVLCLKGRVFDVALDVRKNSKILKFDKVILSENKLIYILF